MNNNSRRSFIKTLGLGTAALLLPEQLFTQRTSRGSPNIIFIMADDHAAHALSCYGSRINQTPNLDRLAQEGVRFQNCFCTNSICAPSRASILTGMYSHRNGVIDNSKSLKKNLITFPELLQSQGYHTALIGKYHLKTDPVGFNDWSVLPGQGHYYNPDFIINGKQQRFTGHVTTIITDQVLDWLQNNKQQKPFCLLYQFKAPHSNFMPALEYLDNYVGKDIPLPDTFFDDYATRSAAAREATMRIAEDMFGSWHLKLGPQPDEPEWIRNYWEIVFDRLNKEQQKRWNAAYEPRNKDFRQANLKGDDLAIWKYQRFIKDYLRCIDGIDHNVGRVLDYLDRAGLANDTMVIYTSDQGFFLGEHGWWDKRFMYEESIRMPLLVRYPREIPSGTVQEDIVLNIDLAPTLLDMAGVSAPAAMQGRTFSKLLRNEKVSDWRQEMYYHYYEYPGRPQVKKHYGIRTQRYKLIRFYDDIDAWEFYDLQQDPLELNNGYTRPEYQTVISDLKAKLKQLQDQYQDTQF